MIILIRDLFQNSVTLKGYYFDNIQMVHVLFLQSIATEE
jgi:hypothetical protein